MTLAGRRILVTRPEGQSHQLVQALREMGAEPIELPLLAIESFDAVKDAALLQDAKNFVQQLDQYSKILFTSTNAVAQGIPLLESYWPQWPIDLNWYGIGVATQMALQRCGVDVADISFSDNPMTTESLLELEDFSDLTQQKVLIVQGEGGRNALAPAFRSRGALVDNLICYRRAKPALLNERWSTLDVSSLDVLLISSGEGLKNLLSLPNSDWCKKTMAIMPSERVAKMASSAGFENIIVADNASDAGMLKALNQL